MRGINGINDGQQVYSYDASFADANNDEVKSLFSYQPPALDYGVGMTEEIALTFPKAFVFKNINHSRCALALNTYLGRDYMGSSGRFGNYLSHVIVADLMDMRNYPVEFYGSNLLRDHMEFGEVNNPNKPDFLPAPTLTRGFSIDIDTVVEFLSSENRLEIYKNMLHAVLAFESERKRVVICDEEKNIILWIAAIEYALPLKIALNINFSTYDFDPSLSAAQICGVLPKGTRYTKESQKLHFVFDLYQNDCIEFEKDECFFDFIDTAMSFSFDSLQDFHRFITDGYTYNKADTQMYAAYRLYSMLSDGIIGMHLYDIQAALNFANNYATPKEECSILHALLEQKDYLQKSDCNLFFNIIEYIVSKYNTLKTYSKEEVKDILVERILFEYLNENSDEETFIEFYEKMDAISYKSDIILASEIVKKNHLKKLFVSLDRELDTWKISFVVKVISTFVKAENITTDNLLIDAPLGQIYYSLVQTVYFKNSQKGFYLITQIIDQFVDDCNYLVNMALNIEGILLDFPNGNHEVSSMWKYFGQAMTKHQCNNFASAYALFAKYQRYEQIYMMYTLSLSTSNELNTITKIFYEHYADFIECNREYTKQYGIKVLCDYYTSLEKNAEENTLQFEIKLLDFLSSNKLDVPFAESLVENIVDDIPLKNPSNTNLKVIQNCTDYIYTILDKPISGKLLLLSIGIIFEKCKKSTQLNNAFNMIESLTHHKRANMSRVSVHTAERYFDWILPTASFLCENRNDMERFYNLFMFSNDVSMLFFAEETRLYLKRSKSNKDYYLLCNYLGLVFTKANNQGKEAVGKVLGKLNKQKLIDLDTTVNIMYMGNKVALASWAELKEISENRMPIFDNISNVFKRKKD